MPSSGQASRPKVFQQRGQVRKIGEILGPILKAGRVFVISDPKVGKLYGQEIVQSLTRAGFETERLAFDLTEAKKKLHSVEQIYRELIRKGVDRDSILLAVGGGVVGDVTGFVAATLLRGLAYVQVPTTLLAQVDAAIGGKVGVNFEDAKNLIGCFYHPVCVIIDPQVLTTLSRRDFLNGMAEVIKYGVILDPDLFTRCESERASWGAENEKFCDEIIARSIRCKTQVVAEDEREQGRRALLNFGHTLGHALELEAAGVLHGEAISLGMAFAARLSLEKKLCKKEDFKRLQDLLENIPHPFTYKKLRFPSIWERVMRDKKRRGGNVRMVLMEGIGKVRLQSVDKEEIETLFFKPDLWWR